MGWPVGVTAFALSATELSRWRRLSRSRLCWLLTLHATTDTPRAGEEE